MAPPGLEEERSHLAGAIRRLHSSAHLELRTDSRLCHTAVFFQLNRNCSVLSPHHPNAILVKCLHSFVRQLFACTAHSGDAVTVKTQQLHDKVRSCGAARHDVCSSSAGISRCTHEWVSRASAIRGSAAAGFICGNGNGDSARTGQR